jgi:hypothetical protein
MKEWIIDRIEGDFAIVEYDGQYFELPLCLLPDLKEGSTLQIQSVVTSSKKDTILEDAEARLNRLKQRSKPPPDVFDL